MKKALVLSLLMLAMSAVAFAGPSLNPWVEVNVPEIVGGVVPSPTQDAGITLEGMLSPAWFINVGFTYDDADLLDSDNDMGLGFESNIGFDQQAIVNTAGTLIYGCEITFACDITYNMNYPADILMVALVPRFMTSGYVGPLEIWAGLNIPWQVSTSNWLLRPLFGLRIDFDIDL